MTRIGLLGGSFDPVHHGHLLVARALREGLGLEELRLVPAGEQPFKRGAHQAPPPDRAAMVSLALDGEPGLACDGREVERPGPSYTVETLRSLAAECPGADLVLCVGADAARELPAWYQAAELPRLATIVVFSRPGAALAPGPWQQAEVPQVDISSTTIRARVRAGRSIRYLVPETVAGYIATHRLYQ